MVAATPVRLRRPCGRLSAYGRCHFGGARLPNVQRTSEARTDHLAHLTYYLVALAEPWPSVCQIPKGGKALGNAPEFAPPLILQLLTRSVAARPTQRGNASSVQEYRYPLRIRFGHSGDSPQQSP